MNSMENPMVDQAGSTSKNGVVADKEELVTAFNKLSDEAKAQFYKDCENGISAEQSRQNTLQFVRRQ